tara:strand:+ start:1273 stop:1518 length:246 start_codon:yes stop_codon:yes gene_type:complete
MNSEIVNLKLITGSTYLKDMIYEVRFADLSKSRINFRDLVSDDIDSVIADSGSHSDFGKSFVFKTTDNGLVVIPSSLLHSN